MTLSLMYPTDHERAEWSRMASDAYRTDRNWWGHRYSMASACLKTCRIDVFDTLQIHYRRWLIGGWEAVEHPE